jgi:hypothetical protein
VKARLHYILVEGSCHRSQFHLVEFEVLLWNNMGISRMLHIPKSLCCRDKRRKARYP